MYNYQPFPQLCVKLLGIKTLGCGLWLQEDPVVVPNHRNSREESLPFLPRPSPSPLSPGMGFWMGFSGS